MQRFGKRLLQFRQEKGVTQAEIAEYLSIPTQYVSAYELDKIIPGIDHLIKLADFYGVSIDHLIGHYPPPEKRTLRPLDHDQMQGLLHYADQVMKTAARLDDDLYELKLQYGLISLRGIEQLCNQQG